MVDKKTVEYVAQLARIAITDEQKEQLCGQLSKILDYIDKLKELDTERIEPLRGFYTQGNVFREDSVLPPELPEAILKNAPSRSGDHFKIPKVIE